MSVVPSMEIHTARQVIMIIIESKGRLLAENLADEMVSNGAEKFLRHILS
jgi:hypothetical protein